MYFVFVINNLANGQGKKGRLSKADNHTPARTNNTTRHYISAFFFLNNPKSRAEDSLQCL